jgi:hypothetical protein
LLFEEPLDLDDGFLVLAQDLTVDQDLFVVPEIDATFFDDLQHLVVRPAGEVAGLFDGEPLRCVDPLYRRRDAELLSQGVTSIVVTAMAAKVAAISRLGAEDSNPHVRIQSPLSYR